MWFQMLPYVVRYCRAFVSVKITLKMRTICARPRFWHNRKQIPSPFLSVYQCKIFSGLVFKFHCICIWDLLNTQRILQVQSLLQMFACKFWFQYFLILPMRKLHPTFQSSQSRHATKQRKISRSWLLTGQKKRGCLQSSVNRRAVE